jgi:signal transduction histidine kinase
MMGQVDRLERATDQVIELARSSGARERQECELDEAVALRAKFWSVLAEEQGREMSLVLDAAGGLVGLGAEEVGLILDTLVGNVFSHTASGTGFEIRSGREDEGALWVQVTDDGEGFHDRSALDRGSSGAGSTGLGLDIARKMARTANGDVQIDNRPGGGAVVRVSFG